MAVAIFLGLIAIQSTMFVRPRRQLTIEVGRTLGPSVVASLDVDGTRHEESIKLPTTFSFHARHVSFSVVPEKNPRESNLAVKAYIGDKHIMSCRSHKGVKGIITAPSLLGLGSNTNGIGGTSPDEIAQLP
ncbi:MAG: hypothetical protein IH899_06500 [Planctomycetes bacterium]|nr:hypothetical protein [Planctomycetota bacterium]